jgi:hypothetical protein
VLGERRELVRPFVGLDEHFAWNGRGAVILGDELERHVLGSRLAVVVE